MHNILKLSQAREVFKCKIFSVTEQNCATDTGYSENIYTLNMLDWVQIIPITAKGNVILVEQFRFGSNSMMRELPGGAMNIGEKDATMAALRELEEETGYTSSRLLGLPGYFPNPAIHGNRIHYFIAFDAEKSDNPQKTHDKLEFIETTEVPFAEALHMARTAQFSHALSALGILLAEPYFNARNRK